VTKLLEVVRFALNGGIVKDISFWSPQKVVPVVTIYDSSQAVKLAQTLIAAGLSKIEITLRTEAALQAITLIAQEVPEAIVGAGTVLNTSMAEKALHAGAQFFVSPGITPSLLQYFKVSSIPFLPGCSTVSEVMYLLENDVNVAKFFPAEDSGGLNYLKSISSVLATMKFCPTGGVNVGNYKNYLDLPNVVCVGGSWVAPSKEITANNWELIGAQARATL
jgi:2-dehydro-3-deoxyphosphogluconate aldolase/(4S)-4-hydroxy-2-oxoglutarate aldolase